MNSKQHPLFGILKGKPTIAPGADLTEPSWFLPEIPDQSSGETSRSPDVAQRNPGSS
ncbi:hypothetical protein [Microbaculum marinum]|uniref:Uncharacterized protein n=1 Tax=Microbaculum marinum TaxID=1764581 RepID=A0AAW9RFP0_9HYPH